MRILFLDDDRQRHWIFQDYCAEAAIVPDHAFDADEAAAMMTRTRYDVAFLDHDLAEEHHRASYVGGPGDGTALARWMAFSCQTLPHIVVIHSYNAEAAERMRGILAPCVTVHVAPFGPGLRSFLGLPGF